MFNLADSVRIADISVKGDKFDMPQKPKFRFVPQIVNAIALGWLLFLLVSSAFYDKDATYPLSTEFLVFVTCAMFLLGFIQLYLEILVFSIKNDYYKRQKTIHDRLRYIASDNIVFDPVTSRRAPANRKYILELLTP